MMYRRNKDYEVVTLQSALSSGTLTATEIFFNFLDYMLFSNNYAK